MPYTHTKIQKINRNFITIQDKLALKEYPWICYNEPKIREILNASKDLEIDRLIGLGSSSKVFHGNYKGKEVAVKAFSYKKEGIFMQEFYKCESPEEREAYVSELESAFFKEGNLLEFLNNPGIIRAYKTLRLNGIPIIIMDYVDGLTLDYVTNEPYNTKRYILSEVAKTVHRLHEKDLIHRDLKPSNILFGYNDDVKVIDLGSAQQKNNHEMNNFDSFGTIPYMAPELFENNMSDNRSDIYAYGILSFVLLTGEHPIISKEREKKSPMSTNTMRSLFKNKPRPLSTCMSINSDIGDVIDQCIKPNIRDRPKSMKEVFERISCN